MIALKVQYLVNTVEKWKLPAQIFSISAIRFEDVENIKICFTPYQKKTFWGASTC